MATLVEDTERTSGSSPGAFWRDPLAVMLVAALVIFAAPTMYFVVSETWTGETGAHAPIILATGLWLLYDTWKNEREVFAAAPAVVPWGLLAIFVPLFLFARITGIVEIEGYVMYACLIAVLLSIVGIEGIKRLWFPLLYLVFVFPPPETVVAAITLPLKMWISQAAVWFLQLVGYPIGGIGVTINIGQYQLLVAAACAGLNTIISLSAIALFYIYVRHKAEPAYFLMLALFVLPVAMFANFIRVLILILLTYHFGEAVGQGFMHNFAGLFMFALSLVSIYLLDEFLHPRWARRRAAKLEGESDRDA